MTYTQVLYDLVMGSGPAAPYDFDRMFIRSHGLDGVMHSHSASGHLPADSLYSRLSGIMDAGGKEDDQNV